jgi:hypothetical protein
MDDEADADRAAAEEDAKRQWRDPGTTEMMEVSWADATRHRRVDATPLPAQERAKLASISLPVLLPADASLLGRAVLSHGSGWYAASLHGDRHHIALHGTHLAVHHPELRAELEGVELPPVRIARTHGIVTASFEAFGASYAVDVECDAPMSDPRCTDDEYVRTVVDGLGVAGGADAQGGTR